MANNLTERVAVHEIPALATLRPTCFSRAKLNFFSLACLTKKFAYGFDLACVAGEISRVRAFVLVAKS